MVRVVVFLKLPHPGEVKTRLAHSVGKEKAAALYRTWVPPFIQSLTHHRSEISLEVALAPPENGLTTKEALIEEAKDWLGCDLDWSIQVGVGLGERLKRAFEEQFDKEWNRVLALGTDSPHLSWHDLSTCIHLLTANSLVLGPTEDGGYYTVGMNQRPGTLFQEVRWSSPSTYRDTESAARNMGWSIGRGPLSYDIDTIADLNRLIDERAMDCWPDLESILKEE